MTERQEKRTQFEQGKKRGFLPWIAVAVAVVAATAAVAGWTAVGGGKGGKYPLVSAEGGRIVIPLSRVSDGQAHFFSYQSAAGSVDFFVLRSHDGVIRAALDTCDVCYQAKKGYRQEGDFMVCNNCDQKFRSDMINEVKGGCNPAPLARAVEGERIVIAAAELEQGAKYFQVQ
jgi:uncharacterized membrane protein